VNDNYRHSVIAKNGAGSVIYIGWEMIVQEGLKNLDDRKEIFNEQNISEIGHIPNFNNFYRRKFYKTKPTLGERYNNNS
jgi:hypothetical protein